MLIHTKTLKLKSDTRCGSLKHSRDENSKRETGKCHVCYQVNLALTKKKVVLVDEKSLFYPPVCYLSINWIKSLN